MFKEGYPVILLIEDDRGYQKLVSRALNQIDMGEGLQIAATAEEGLQYLKDLESPEPDLILLDLSMPGMDGKEFLKIIKDDEKLCTIPVVVLTVSDQETDVEECYKLQAAGYIEKVVRAEDLKKVIAKVAEYWFDTSYLAKDI